mmetsp:Transcript_950/g.2656  ORF Transcript_950/g.2656 Transcript_950/m.2656 type:complete len:85 (-) Transcript_950:203-457(-)
MVRMNLLQTTTNHVLHITGPQDVNWQCFLRNVERFPHTYFFRNRKRFPYSVDSNDASMNFILKRLFCHDRSESYSARFSVLCFA